jgi:glycosyltransferase involved in cell wall biosynthesis
MDNPGKISSMAIPKGRILSLSSRLREIEGRSIPKSLTIVIPALNEEDAIGATIERCLAARESILRDTPIREIAIIVVSDGSTDRTAEIALSYESVDVIAYEKNLGYGAAIKRGFSKASSDLLCFLDADGTCDPEYFVDLCNAAINDSADLVLGCRMHKESKMRGLRRFGNRMYAAMASYLSGKKIIDTATGMRVIRRDALPKLYPLPTGLHFTPAMTFRALVSDLLIRELPVPYHERTGRSKLRILPDGLRFFFAIIEIALCYCPLKFFGSTSTLLFLVALCYSIDPAWNYVAQHIVGSNFIYRQILINTFFLAGLLTLSIGVVAERVAATLNGNNRRHSALGRWVLRLCSTRKMLVTGFVLIVIGVFSNIGGLAEYLITRHVSYHWGVLSIGSLCVLAGLQLTAMGIFELLVNRILERNTNGHKGN